MRGRGFLLSPYPFPPSDKMEIKENRKVIFICRICGTATRRVPLCGATDQGFVWLCRNCGPIDWEVMAACREAVVGARLN